MLKSNVDIVFVEVGRPHAFPHNLNYIAQCPPLPAFGEAVDDLDVFVAGEAEVDKPFAVEQPRRLFQQRNPAPVVLDQVVVGGEGLT